MSENKRSGCRKCNGHIGDTEDIAHWHCYQEIKKQHDNALGTIEKLERSIVNLTLKMLDTE